ncbi:hydroxypyruvate reductase [Peptococcaceae bacterium CEB3]|nr:hydroxypyruvate reductase [Peptococcaceae bacterium CEB3]
MLNMLHLSQKETDVLIFTPAYRERLATLGNLQIVSHANKLSLAERLKLIGSCDVLITSWGSSPVPAEIASQSGKLRYICHVTGTLREFIPLEVIESDIPVTNWGNAPADFIAEGAMTLLLATLKDLHAVIHSVRAGGWKREQEQFVGGTLRGLRVGLYGLGFIGQRFVELIRPFGCEMNVYDPFVKELPNGCRPVHSLTKLFQSSDAVVINAALNSETEKSVNRDMLALLPDQGIVVNTARGDIIDQGALFDELRSGRLRAGLDVLANDDCLLPDDEARKWSNCILTAHQIERSAWPEEDALIREAHEISLDNIARFSRGEPLRFRMDVRRYGLST